MIFLRSSTGIEVGETDLTVAVARNSFGQLRLVAVHRLDAFMTLSEDERKKTLQSFIKVNRVPSSRVYLSLPREQGIVRQIQLPADIQKKLSDVVKMQVETVSPWPVGEIYWNFAAEIPKKDQKFITVTIVIVPRLHLDPWIAFFKSVGMPLNGASLSSLAQGHGINILWDESKPTIVLHVEQSYTEGIFVNGSRFAALTAPTGENGSVPSMLMDRLLSAAKLQSTEGTRLIVSGKLQEPGADDNPRLPLEGAKPDSARDFGPVAAALLAFKASAFKANLVPPGQRYRESQIRLIPAAALALLAVMVGAGLLVREPYQNKVYASELDGEIKKIAPKVKEVANQEKELDQLTGRYRALTSQLLNHDYALETVGELARNLPDSAFLTSYSYQDGAITISGLAQSASEIQKLLESSAMFRNVEFAGGVARDSSGKDRFTLKMVLEGPK